MWLCAKELRNESDPVTGELLRSRFCPQWIHKQKHCQKSDEHSDVNILIYGSGGTTVFVTGWLLLQNKQTRDVFTVSH